MREVLDDIDRWHAAGRRVVIARVVETEGSGPRAPGAAMAVDDTGEVSGSVSGGCVEGAVVTEALRLLAGERDQGVVSFGYSDEDAFAVGLTCGGTVHVFLELSSRWAVSGHPIYEALARALRTRRPIALATIVGGPGIGTKLIIESGIDAIGTLGDAQLDRAVETNAFEDLGAGTTSVRRYGAHGEAGSAEVTVFIESFVEAPVMVILGAVEFSAALARVAKVVGYRVVVCDARTTFATDQRFPMADEVVNEWPDRYLSSIADTLGPRDAVCVLTHDNKFDVPAIREALRTEVGYVGALGSRRTHERRLGLLVEAGIGEQDLERLHAPIGLDIGASTPEETAIAVCAEVIAARTGHSGRSLRETSGTIH